MVTKKNSFVVFYTFFCLFLCLYFSVHLCLCLSVCLCFCLWVWEDVFLLSFIFVPSLSFIPSFIFPFHLSFYLSFFFLAFLLSPILLVFEKLHILGKWSSICQCLKLENWSYYKHVKKDLSEFDDWLWKKGVKKKSKWLLSCLCVWLSKWLKEGRNFMCREVTLNVVNLNTWEIC